MIDPQTKYVHSDKVSHADVQDETILLHFERSEYFGLNAVGQSVWRLLTTPRSQDEVVQKLLEEYDVEEVTLRSDIEKLLIDLQQNGIIKAA